MMLCVAQSAGSGTILLLSMQSQILMDEGHEFQHEDPGGEQGQSRMCRTRW